MNSVKEFLDGVEVSDEASLVSENLLRSYKLQDKRSEYLKSGEFDKAKEAENEALHRMGLAYTVDFPESENSYEAGKKMMEALFIQDEIENWEEFPDKQYLLYAEPIDGRKDQLSDPRWDEVESSLEDLTEYVGIDEEFASKKTKYFKLHGLKNEGYEDLAREAHRIKLRAMLDQDEEEIKDLSEYFVKGSNLHDKWKKGENDEVLRKTQDLVSEYYQKIFNLRENNYRDNVKAIQKVNA